MSADPRVGMVVLATASYGSLDDREGGGGAVSRALARLAESLGWPLRGAGIFGRLVAPGARVLVKPNWVMHANHGPWGIEPLVTHASVIGAVVEELLRSRAGRVVVGDAPLQACDFAALLRATGMDGWSEAQQVTDARFAGIRDFRRTTCEIRDGVRVPQVDRRPREDFILFDLGTDSLLEQVTDERRSFRVTQYDPSQMVATHGKGRHQYLVARDVIESDVIFNLPKLKTHKKAGLTCALKNLIGINGNKEYLPHHRVGGAAVGGDCYPGRSPLKRALEYAFDRQHQATSHTGRQTWYQATRVLNRLVRASGDVLGVEGSWSGNDTLWRTCLDLNRIVLYGRPDGTLADSPQRAVFHIVDAIVAGQGDGPLAPQPLPLRRLFAGASAAAVDWVAARLLGYQPERIPIVREAFGAFRWPIAGFSPDGIVPVCDGVSTSDDVFGPQTVPVTYPVGWRDAVIGLAAAYK
ncbi:MAG TPA: DUF362 domain-containing protein [Gemmatimonadales bacterium]|nr:DUF362 domain-containing protein [Gemmatimonadales bacterium]